MNRKQSDAVAVIVAFSIFVLGYLATTAVLRLVGILPWVER